MQELKAGYIDVERNETDLAGGQKLLLQESLPNIHILSPDIFCGNKNLPPDKNSGRSKAVPTLARKLSLAAIMSITNKLTVLAWVALLVQCWLTLS